MTVSSKFIRSKVIRWTGFFAIAGGLLWSCNSPQSENASTQNAESDVPTAVEILGQAYLYGYPILTMDYTHKVSTNVVEPNALGKAPLNQFGGMKQFPKAGFKAVVRPNLDTYYSLIYADLKETPLYVYIPATERYYLIPILNAYGDVVKSLGSRTTGQGDLHLALVGPDYDGEIPEDLMVVKSNTNLNWLLGRVQVSNDEDGKDEVANFQNKLIARPLAERDNADYVAPKGTVNPDYKVVPMQAVDNLSIADYFNQMMALMVNNPPQEGDEKMVAAMKSVGIVPGGTFDISQFSEEEQAQIQKIPTFIQKKFAEMTAKPREELMQNGWNVNTSGLGEYGTNYALRAYVTKIGFGANTAEDAIYPNSAIDTDGNNYSGDNNYVLHFDADKLPPAKGFWSLTMYDKEGFLVDNAIDRYNLGNKHNLTYNEDGSVDIYIQYEEPKMSSNWLPSPPPGQEFELTFRMYWPEEEVLNRTWQMPGVVNMSDVKTQPVDMPVE